MLAKYANKKVIIDFIHSSFRENAKKIFAFCHIMECRKQPEKRQIINIYMLKHF